MSGPRLCLACDTPLAQAQMCDQGDGCMRCSCGVIYGAEMVLDADPELWEHARTNRQFVRHGDELIVYWMTAS